METLDPKIVEALNKKQDILNVTLEVSHDNDNPVASSAVARLLDQYTDGQWNVKVPVDESLDKNSNNAISNKAVYEALENKESKIVLDDKVLPDSENAVKNKGIYEFVEEEKQFYVDKLNTKQDLLNVILSVRQDSDCPVSSRAIYDTISKVRKEILDYLDSKGINISTISVNGVVINPDDNGKVDIEFPRALSYFENDTDYVTKEYVDTMGGPINTISVNGNNQAIVEKNVNIQVPTKNSQIENDTNYVNSSDLQVVREMAEGKNTSYVVSCANNPVFNSNEKEIDIPETFITILNETIQTSSLKNGDVILVSENDIPDRWKGDGKLFILETEKIDLTPYVKYEDSIETDSIDMAEVELLPTQQVSIIDIVEEVRQGSSDIPTSGAVYNAIDGIRLTAGPNVTIENGVISAAGAVNSVAGKTGDIVLGIEDVSGLSTSLNSKQSTIVLDSVPTSGSTNFVNSGAIYDAIPRFDIEGTMAPIEATDILTPEQIEAVNSGIIESGTSGIWNYRIWSNNVMECWARVELSSVTWQAWGQLFETAESTSSVAYPYPYSSVPIETATFAQCSSGYPAWVVTRTACTTTNSGVYGAVRPTAGANSNLYFAIHTIGTKA